MQCKENCEIEMTTNFHVTNFHSMKFKITLSPCFFFIIIELQFQQFQVNLIQRKGYKFLLFLKYIKQFITLSNAYQIHFDYNFVFLILKFSVIFLILCLMYVI